MFDQTAKLGEASRDTYNPGLWLILSALLKNGVAEGVASDSHDTIQKCTCVQNLIKRPYFQSKVRFVILK